MNYLYLDANIYIKFYLGNKLFKILELLIQNKDNIIITEQISNEVIRNAVSVNLSNYKNTLANFQLVKPSIPYKNNSVETIKQIDELSSQFKILRKNIENEFESHLTLVSTQKDEITIKLKQIFENALKPSDKEIEKAKTLKTFGNPPGKKADPIGDELSWIQVLNKIQKSDKLIIVTNDRDYASVYNSKSILNAKLHSDLEPYSIEYYVYSEITEGFNKFKELQENAHENFETKEFLSEVDYKEIKEEEAKIIVEKNEQICSHHHISRRLNGIYLEYFCEDCYSILHRQYFDDTD